MLKLTCPHCQSQFSFAVVPPGTPVRCRSCRESFSTPESGSGAALTPEHIFGPAAGRAAAVAPSVPTPAQPPVPVPVQTFTPLPTSAPPPVVTPAPIYAEPPATPVPAAPVPAPEPTPAPEPAPIFARKSDPAPEPVPASEPLPAPELTPLPEPISRRARRERALPKSVRGPLEAETAHVCPKCGLTSVSLRSGGAPWWTSHALGVITLGALCFVMPRTVSVVIGIAVWAFAYLALNVFLRSAPGFKCSTCRHAWQ